MPEVAIPGEATSAAVLLSMEMWLWIAVVVVLTAGVVVPLWRTIRRDGWGHRPPPPARVEASPWSGHLS